VSLLSVGLRAALYWSRKSKTWGRLRRKTAPVSSRRSSLWWLRCVSCSLAPPRPRHRCRQYELCCSTSITNIIFTSIIPHLATGATTVVEFIGRRGRIWEGVRLLSQLRDQLTRWQLRSSVIPWENFENRH